MVTINTGPVIANTAGIDPILLRRMYAELTGLDPGPNPQFFSNILQTALAVGILPVVPVNNRKPGFNTPLDVYPRGWWGGGVVDTTSGQTQTNVSASTTNVTITNAFVTYLTITLPAAKTLYVTDYGGGAQSSTTVPALGIRVQDTTNAATVAQMETPQGTLVSNTPWATSHFTVPIAYANPSAAVTATIGFQLSGLAATGTLVADGFISAWYE